MWSFVSFFSEKKVEELWSLPIPGEVRMDPDPKGGILRRGRRKMRGDKVNSTKDDAEERNAAPSFVSFSSEEETNGLSQC